MAFAPVFGRVFPATFDRRAAVAGLDWRKVGPTYWPAYAASIAATNAAHSSSPDSLTTPTGTYPGSYAYAGGVLLPDGRVFCVPRNATSARIYDPVANSLTTPAGTYPGSNSYYGGVLLPDGRVFCVPLSATSARIYDGSDAQYDINVVLSAYYNKF